MLFLCIVCTSRRGFCCVRNHTHTERNRLSHKEQTVPSRQGSERCPRCSSSASYPPLLRWGKRLKQKMVAIMNNLFSVLSPSLSPSCPSVSILRPRPRGWPYWVMAKAHPVPICLLWQGPEGTVWVNTDGEESFSSHASFVWLGFFCVLWGFFFIFILFLLSFSV